MTVRFKIIVKSDPALGVVNSKKFCCWKGFSTDFGQKVTDLPSLFHLTSIWSSTETSKSEALKSTLLCQCCTNQRILLDLLYQFLKKQIYKDNLIWANFIKKEMDIRAFDFEVAVHCAAPDWGQMLNAW